MPHERFHSRDARLPAKATGHDDHAVGGAVECRDGLRRLAESLRLASGRPGHHHCLAHCSITR